MALAQPALTVCILRGCSCFSMVKRVVYNSTLIATHWLHPNGCLLSKPSPFMIIYTYLDKLTVHPVFETFFERSVVINEKTDTINVRVTPR